MPAILPHGTPFRLTSASNRYYAFSTAGVPVVGFDSLNGAAIGRKRSVWRLFHFASGVPLYGRPGGEAVRLAGAPSVCQPRFGPATQSFDSDGGGLQPLMEHTL